MAISTHLLSWWHHDMETLSTLLAYCEGNLSFTGHDNLCMTMSVHRIKGSIYKTELAAAVQMKNSQQMQAYCTLVFYTISNPDSKVHGANMGPTWGWQDPGGPHLGHMNLAIWEEFTEFDTVPQLAHPSQLDLLTIWMQSQCQFSIDGQANCDNNDDGETNNDGDRITTTWYIS